VNHRFPRSLAEAFPAERAYAVEFHRGPSLWRHLAGLVFVLAALLIVPALLFWGPK
jgi:hypothetical protein